MTCNCDGSCRTTGECPLSRRARVYDNSAYDNSAWPSDQTRPSTGGAWQCPGCGSWHAPHSLRCDCHCPVGLTIT